MPPTSHSRRRTPAVITAVAAVITAGTVGLALAGPSATAAGGAAIAGDLACGAVTTATSSAAATTPAAATDCDTTTAWQSAAATLQELKVDLGASRAVDHVTVVWGIGYGTSFKIRTSPDGSSWHTQTAVTGGTGGLQTVALPAGVTTRWIEIYGEHYAGSAGFTVDEFEVFGTASTGTASATPTPTPTPTPSASASASTSPSASPSPTSTGGGGAAAWTGQFSGYGSSAWKSAWGYTSTGSWGASDLQGVTDSTAPGGGSALEVTYGAGSSANSCANCPNPGGGQFYTQLSALSGGSALSNSATLDLKYHLKFPAGYDWGKAGKLPGLYGGVIGQESGGNHGNGWSTRYMWRGANSVPNNGEVYLYTPTNSGPTGYGVDLGVGDWKWLADGNWHTVEQLVNRSTGDITVWFDGAQAASFPGAASGIGSIPFSGVFFSTFYGGHDTSWGPLTTTHSFFADFSLSTTVQH
ncbi:hypothetical protein ABIA32_006510 [Streptacidiphilus sp. MAP12-20]|uniref:discoidin domain-containing protein n=1 Tax=Streptacidiphilus sp. MAP12-20 TaxID=3156299 RepID=UPI0035181941